MSKKIIFIAVAVVLITASVYYFSARESSEKVYRVGVLAGVAELSALFDSFKAEMAELGYIEGENISYDFQVTSVEPERERKILEKFVEDEVDLIVTFPTEVSMLAKEVAEGTGIPVLFFWANIEGTGLVESIANPGGNITGVRYPGPDLAVKRFEVAMELKPGIKTLMVPYQKDYPIVESQMEVLRPALSSAGVELIELAEEDTEGLKASLESISLDETPIDAIILIADPFSIVLEPFEAIAKFATENGILSGGNYMEVNGYATVFGVSANMAVTGQQAASLAKKIFSGVEVGSIPVLSSESYFQLDYNRASALGLEIPEGLLSQADEIIR